MGSNEVSDTMSQLTRIFSTSIFSMQLGSYDTVLVSVVDLLNSMVYSSVGEEDTQMVILLLVFKL